MAWPTCREEIPVSKTAQRVSKEAPGKKTPAAKAPAVKKTAAKAAPVKTAKASAKPAAAKKTAPQTAEAKTKRATPASNSGKTNSKKPVSKTAPAKSATSKPAASKSAANKTTPQTPTVSKSAQVAPKAADSTSQKVAKAQSTAKSSAAGRSSAAAQPVNLIPQPAPVYRPSYPDVVTPMSHTATAVKADPKLANAWKSKAGRDLSDAELLAMPDSEYMSDKQLDFFKSRLEMLKDDLLSNAGETTEHLREDTSIVPDPADRATIEEEHALELRTRDRERKLLKKISQSLARIESGEYGYCDETGEPIGLGRLLARPTATLSLEAQQRRELKQKLFGD